MSKRRRRVWVRVALALLLVTGSALGLHQFRKQSTAENLPTAPAKKGDFLVLLRCRGELSAGRSIQVTAPLDVPDLQIVWLAPAGGAVKAGDTIIKFDPSRLQQELKEKGASLRQAQAALDQGAAQARNISEQDKLDLATARYQMERAKLEASKQTIMSKMQGQESEIDLGLAEEKVKVQEAGSALHQASNVAKMASLQRLRDEAKMQLELTDQRLARMELKSPLNGVVNYLSNFSQGWMNAQPFKVGDHAVGGGALAEIPDLATLQVESKIDEVDRGRLVLGESVVVHVDAFPEKTFNARLTSITPLVEESFGQWPPTRSFKAYAKLETRDERLRPGMNAGADVVQTKLPGAISIPAKALFTLRGKPSVYVKDQNRFIATEVNVKARNPDEIAVEGIAPGTLVALAEPQVKK